MKFQHYENVWPLNWYILAFAIHDVIKSIVMRHLSCNIKRGRLTPDDVIKWFVRWRCTGVTNQAPGKRRWVCYDSALSAAAGGAVQQLTGRGRISKTGIEWVRCRKLTIPDIPLLIKKLSSIIDQFNYQDIHHSIDLNHFIHSFIFIWDSSLNRLWIDNLIHLFSHWEGTTLEAISHNFIEKVQDRSFIKCRLVTDGKAA